MTARPQRAPTTRISPRAPAPGRSVASAHAGVVASDLGLCTYSDEARFFSYRRTTHRGEADFGRHLAAIVLAGD